MPEKETDKSEPNDDAQGDDDEGGDSQESEENGSEENGSDENESDVEIFGTEIDSGSDARSHRGQDVEAVVVSEESPLGSQSGAPVGAVEQVVLQLPDGGSEIYELDAHRDSNVPPEKLPLVGTKIGEYAPPSSSIPGLFVLFGSKGQFI